MKKKLIKLLSKFKTSHLNVAEIIMLSLGGVTLLLGHYLLALVAVVAFGVLRFK